VISKCAGFSMNECHYDTYYSVLLLLSLFAKSACKRYLFRVQKNLYTGKNKYGLQN